MLGTRVARWVPCHLLDMELSGYTSLSWNPCGSARLVSSQVERVEETSQVRKTPVYSTLNHNAGDET